MAIVYATHMKIYDFDSSKAFVSKKILKPFKPGKLSGLTFAVKDLIDIKDEVTGCGNPTWAKTHPKASAHAISVEQLLYEGASCLGKVVTDELAFSLLGENYFFGTPVNPKAPDRVPGGSSCGSASAVACGLVDFALGTDTGGSVRVPASNCGIWGYRPSHGLISFAGVNPLAVSFDTVGVLSSTGEVLKKVASVLTGFPIITNYPAPKIFVLKDIFDICDQEVQQALTPVLDLLKQNFSVADTHLAQLCNESIDYQWLYETHKILQGAEIWSSLGAWIEDVKPEFGPVIQNNFHNIAKVIDRSQIQDCVERRAWFANKLSQFLEQKSLLCFPTTPALAPKVGTLGKDPHARVVGMDYYSRILGMCAISALSRAPQISIPVGNIDGVPIGLSMVTSYGEDAFLSAACADIATSLCHPGLNLI